MLKSKKQPKYSSLKRLNPLWPVHAVEYYADSEKNLESLHTLTYPNMNSDDRADYFAKIKNVFIGVSELKTLEKNKIYRYIPNC